MKSKQLFSKVSSDGQLTVSLQEVDVPEPKENEVVVKIEASPINPSDMWPLLGPSDLSKAVYDADAKTLSAPVPSAFLPMIRPRLDMDLPVGNEGAGTVVAAGSGDYAQSLLGKTVGVMGGVCFAEYVCAPVHACLVHRESTSAQQAASSFVNPLTALGMVETMRMENHTALVHTAAASNLGQMLNKICLAEDVPLVNIVRRAEQAELLKSQGAKYVVNSSDEDFAKQLYMAIDTTGATLGFDATGGGELASAILTAMEASGSKDAKGLNTYGSLHHKQVYLYGGLDTSPTVLKRAYGMFWGVGGWLLTGFLGKIGREKIAELHQRVANEIDTTFAAHFDQEISLEEALKPETVMAYNAKKTGQKYLINPTLGQ